MINIYNDCDIVGATALRIMLGVSNVTLQDNGTFGSEFAIKQVLKCIYNLWGCGHSVIPHCIDLEQSESSIFCCR